MLLCRFQEIPLKIYKETLTLKETSYQNNKDTYNFDDFNIRSSFDEDRFEPLMSTLLILLRNRREVSVC
jgi:hypothetical protein